MRVIAGKYKGRKLIAPQGYDVRPTTDFTKEALFAIVRERIVDCRYLDLFGGSGALAIEALSRGAKTVVVSDKAGESVNLIKRNLSALGASCEVYSGDYADVCFRLKGRQFDLIMLDPPYAMGISPVFEAIEGNELLAEDGLIVYEHDSHDKVELSDRWVISDSRRYGRVTLTFVKKSL